MDMGFCSFLKGGPDRLYGKAQLVPTYLSCHHGLSRKRRLGDHQVPLEPLMAKHYLVNFRLSCNTSGIFTTSL